MSGHTKGPWRIEAGDSVIRILAGEARIADTSSKRYYERSDATDLANAALIAAAPEMLEALEDIVEQFEASRVMAGADLSDSIRVFGKQAIARAKGETK